MIRLLHISDPHFDTSGHHAFSLPTKFSTNDGLPEIARPIMVDAIAEAIQGLERIDGLIVTGDLTFTASDTEFSCAEEELLRLQELLKIKKEHILLIPGNHDANWEKHRNMRFHNFANAFKVVTGHDFTTPFFKTFINIGDDNIGLQLLGVNSAAIESKEDQGIGLVGDIRLRQFLRERASNIHPERMTVTILCMHHHILPVAYLETDYFENGNKRTSVTLDAKAILSSCGEHKVGMVLHGHQHQPSLIRYQSLDPLQETMNPTNPIWVSGCGSTGIKDEHLGDVKRRHFQILEFEKKHGVVSCNILSFTSAANNRYKFVQTATAPITLNSNLTPDVGSCIMDLEEAQADLTKKIDSTTANEIEIQHIGLDMFTAKNRLLEMLNKKFPPIDVTINLLVITADLEELRLQFGDQLPVSVNSMPEYVNPAIKHIYKELRTVVDNKYKAWNKKLTVNIRKYKRLPSIHGFSLLVGPKTEQQRIASYCSLFRWKKKELTDEAPYWDLDWGGADHEASYRFIPGDSNDFASQDMMAVFQGEFEHLWENSEEWDKNLPKVYGRQ